MAFTRIDSPLRLTITYVFFALAWILGSDALVAWQLDEGLKAWLIDSTKGLLFVSVTAGLLFMLVRRLVRQYDLTEKALRLSEKRLALALEAGNQGLFDLDIQTGEAVVNDTYATMLGYDPATFRETNATWRERLHPEDREKVYQNYADYVAGKTNDYRVEFRQKDAAGGWRWTLSMGRIVERDAQGRPKRMLGTHTDISSYKSADARTMDALAFGQAVFNSSPEAVIAYGPDGRAVIANKAAARIIGTDLPGLLEQNFRELDSWRESGLLAAAEEALASGWEVRRTGPVTTTFGHTRQLATIMVPFDHQSGRHLLLVISDVTENLRVIERLQVMHAAILAVPIGWVVTDPTGVIEWVNPAFTTLTGYAAEEVIGKNPRVLKSGRHSAEFYKAMWSTIARGEVWSGEIFNQRKDGGLYHEYMTIAPVCDEHGDIMHFVAMKQDLSERKNLEQQLARAQRLESIGLLASGIAHDLNNIFAPIQLSLELLKLKYPAADGKKMVELIEASVHRGAGIVRQVLTFARGIESQRMILNPKYLVKELAQILDETFTRQIKIVTRVENDLKSIEADSTQLHQVLLNLAINARDAMPNGGTLLLSATNVEVDSARAMLNPPLKPGPHVALIVEDTGSGISPEVLEHMFEPFYTTKPRGQGTGLGLSTVYGIVRNHGGALEVSSQLGVGTKFTVLLPAKDEAPAKPDSNAPMPAVVQGNGRRILVVDDEESIRLVTLHVLKRNGFVPLVAIDGVEALEIFRSDPTTFAGMITDLMMPRMNGQQLIMEVRRLAPMLPIIASSGLFEGKIDESPETTLQSLGVKTMLRKPYTEEELLEALRTELEPKEAKTS